MLQAKDRGLVGRARDTWKPQALGGRIRGASVEPDLPPFTKNPLLRALCNAGTAMKIFASHLGKFPRNPDKSRGASFSLLICSPLPLKLTN